ncbi:MAG: amino acid ABC transporter ATP-binding protein [Rubrivivax sp.]
MDSRADDQSAVQPLVSIDQVEKVFGPTRILDKVSASIGAGQVLSLIGPSGSGKTTLLRCVNFLERYDGGRITVNGKSVGYVFNERGQRRLRSTTDIAAGRAEVGMVFQSYNLFPHMTAIENVVVAPTKVRGMARAPAMEAGMELLKLVGLDHKARSYPAALSGGQQQRVAIARALAMKPRLLLMDEVTSALDPQLVGEVLDVIGRLAADGMTMILATHEMEFARQVSSQVLFMADGQVVESGPPQKLFGNPDTERLRKFLQRYNARQPAH